MPISFTEVIVYHWFNNIHLTPVWTLCRMWLKRAGSNRRSRNSHWKRGIFIYSSLPTLNLLWHLLMSGNQFASRSSAYEKCSPNIIFNIFVCITSCTGRGCRPSYCYAIYLGEGMGVESKYWICWPLSNRYLCFLACCYAQTCSTL